VTTPNDSILTDPSARDRIAELLRTHGIKHFEVHEQIDSSNSTLMQRPFLSDPSDLTLCWALRQSAGRGRRGRVWQSFPEHSLTFSISFEYLLGTGDAQQSVRLGHKLSSLSPAVGLHLAQALSALSPSIKVKWPNDLWRDARKVGGILLEATQRGGIQRVVIGIGLNLFWAAEPFTQSAGQGLPLPQTPGGLFDTAPSNDLKLRVLATCAGVVASLAKQCQSNDSTARWFADWNHHDALAEREVALYHEHRDVAYGINVGVDEDGALLLRRRLPDASGQMDDGQRNKIFDGSVQRFEIGEVSLRTSPL
jgi:BirA family transcriptional regulator, biotin operon repressor / biotin---[acetyl-CoA-carboxylase] ligase